MVTVLTSYYAFLKANGQSQTRYNEARSTKDYTPLEEQRNKSGKLILYYSDIPPAFSALARSNATKCLIAQSKHVSSIYFLDEQALYGIGDIRGTNDAFLIVFDEAKTRFEVFIAPGYKHHLNALSNAFTEQHFKLNIKALRLAARG